MNKKLPDNAEDRLKETFFLVEAEDTMSLWRDYSPQSNSPRWPVKSWEQVMTGWMVTVGYLTTFHKAKDLTVDSEVTICRAGLTNGITGIIKKWDAELYKWRVSFNDEFEGWYTNDELIVKDEYKIRPVNISLDWAWIDNQLIGFWYPCSQLVDREMIDRWFEENFHGTHDGRRSMVNHQNFHNCIRAINNKNKE